MKKNVIGFIVFLIVVGIVYSLDVKLIGPSEAKISYTTEYQDLGCKSFLPVRIDNPVEEKIGTYFVNFDGFIKRVRRKVIVIDDVKPYYEGETEFNVVLNSAFEPSLKAMDEIDGEVPLNCSSVDTSKLGRTVSYCTSTDKSKNELKLELKINVIPQI